MDPIHPIVPRPPTLPPIAPAPATGRIDREANRGGPGADRRRRRRPPGAATEGAPEVTHEPAQAPEDDDPGLHVDLTA